MNSPGNSQKSHDEKQKCPENSKSCEIKNSINEPSNSTDAIIDRPISPYLALSLKIGEV
jgi:hypothetical protein